MKKSSATVYLICGFIGAGKTTFAKKLEQKTGAVRITKDEWLISLFGHDPTIEHFEMYDNTICRLANDIAFEFIKRGVDVIIDDGFWIRKQRDEMREKIKHVGGKVILYYLPTPMEAMKKRVVNRNQRLSKDSFEISEVLFEKYQQYWEPPQADEEFILAELV